MTNTVSAHAAETPDGRLLALVVLPMRLDAFIALLNAITKAHPDAVLREATVDYTITHSTGKDAE